MGILLLWLLMTAPAADIAAPPKAVGGTYKTARTMQVLEKCLYDELSDLGDATFMRSQGDTILMIRNGQGPPLLVEITPPKVEITTRASLDVKARVKRCL
jgi:hypothetical protein